MNIRSIAVTAALLIATFAGAWSAEPSAVKAESFKGYRRVGLSLPGSQTAFVKKGDRVDVISIFDANMKDGKEKVAATILQDVLVSNVIPARAAEQGAIELWVNPNEAQYLALGLRQGDIHIAVRPEGDTEMKPMEMASFRKLFK